MLNPLLTRMQNKRKRKRGGGEARGKLEGLCNPPKLSAVSCCSKQLLSCVCSLFSAAGEPSLAPTSCPPFIRFCGQVIPFSNLGKEIKQHEFVSVCVCVCFFNSWIKLKFAPLLQFLHFRALPDPSGLPWGTGFGVLQKRCVMRDGWSPGFLQPADVAQRARQECVPEWRLLWPLQ